MQYQKIKVEAVQGKKSSEPLLYSVSSNDKGASGIVGALEVVDWRRAFSLKCLATTRHRL